jgi:hypothetical protein
MDRQARRTYFESLCNLRNSYESLGTDDTTSVISIEAIIEHAISLLERPSSPMIVMLEGSPEAN